MADIAILVDGTSVNSGQLHLSCTAYVSDSPNIIGFGVDISWNAVPSTINAAIKTAAIAAAADAGSTVGALDTKTLFGAAVGL